MAGDWVIERKNINASRVDGKLCDFKILVDGETFPVHRVILDACSEYFRAMFASKTLEVQQGYCELKDVSAQVVNLCIEFMYTEQLEMTDSMMAIAVLKLVHLWNLEKAVKKCEEFLSSSLDIENCILVRKHATLYDIRLLGSNCDQFILSNIKTLQEQDSGDISTLSLLEVEEILKLGQARHCNLVGLWEFCMRWADIQNDRRKPFCKIIKQFAVGNFSVSNFKRYVWENLHIKECVRCRECSCKKILHTLHMPRDLTNDNCIFLKHLAVQYGNLCLLQICDAFICEHTNQVFKSTDFVTYTTEMQLLGYTQMLYKKSCTATQFSAIVAWLKQSENRQEAFPKLFKQDKATGAENIFIKSLNKMMPVHTTRSVLGFTFSSALQKEKWMVLTTDIFFIKHLSSKYSCHALQKTVDEFIMEHFDKVSDMPEYLELPLSDLVKYVRNIKIYSIDPCIVWNAILRWVYHDCERNLSDVFELMLLHNFPLSFIQKTICKCDLVLSCRTCTAHLFDVIFNEIEEMKDRQINLSERLAILEK